MPLISAKCTNCGANLEVDNTKEAAICPYCNTAYVVEKAVNYYNTTNNITANVVNVYGGNSADFVIRAGELVKYNGASTEVYIPNIVKVIGAEAFRWCSGLEKVTIPDGITKIGQFAFGGCQALIEVILPDSVTDICPDAFIGCRSLQKITLPKNLEMIGNSMFDGCEVLETIVIPDTVQEIGQHAFRGCAKLSRIQLGRGVKKVGLYAFYGCKSLTEIVFPEGVVEISSGAFSGCKSLRTVTFLGNTKVCDYAFSGCESLSALVFKGNTNVYSDAFRGCQIDTIEASEEWKRKNYYIFSCLSSCAPKTSSGCYIATAVYGSYDCPQVWTLRRFRDDILATSWYGRTFIRLYYAVSPTLVKLFGHTNWFKKLWRGKLDDIVEKLQKHGVASSPYCDREW